MHRIGNQGIKELHRIDQMVDDVTEQEIFGLKACTEQEIIGFEDVYRIDQEIEDMHRIGRDYGGKNMHRIGDQGIEDMHRIGDYWVGVMQRIGY